MSEDFSFSGSLFLILFLVVIALISLYLFHVNRALCGIPDEAFGLSPTRWTVQEVIDASETLKKSPISAAEYLPPKFGRRYIVVGGSGLIGGWIVSHLLLRGEDPACIRIIDVRRPIRKDLKRGLAKQVAFRQADITDPNSLGRAFKDAWPTEVEDRPLTVFHTVATIRFYERHPSLLPLSASINVEGTRNVIAASKAVGAGTLIYTSSASVAVQRLSIWLPVWKKWPSRFVQRFDDADESFPVGHDEFFSNYAVSKWEAEKLVRAADDPASGFRTGCIRPANGAYGPGGDTIAGAYLARGYNPGWASSILQSFVYAENVSLALLLFDQRLAELQTLSEPSCPDIGGQSFIITDPNPPITFGDLHLVLNTLTGGECRFPHFSPVLMLLLAYILEAYHIVQLRLFPKSLPKLSSDLVNLQPPLFFLTSAHLIFDDSRARLPPEEGGLGYRTPWTSLMALCNVVHHYQSTGGDADAKSLDRGGFGHGWGAPKAKKLETPAPVIKID